MSKDLARPLKVTAWLDSPVAGPEGAMLDAVVELMRSHDDPAAVPRGTPVPRERVGKIKTPILRETIAGWSVPCCSSPIFCAVSDDHHYYTRSLATVDSLLLAPEKRKVLNTTGGEHKSYRLPLRVRTMDRMVWYCCAMPRWLERLLQNVRSVGKKNSFGYGQVARWEVQPIADDWSWYAQSEHGPVLMRPLPDGEHLPIDLLGARKTFRSVCGPYWQNDLYTEAVEPC